MERKRTIRLLVYGEQLLVREGLRCLVQTQPDFTVVGSTGDRAEAIHLARSHQAKVAVVHSREQGAALDLLRDLAAVPLSVLVLASTIDRTGASAALQVGTRGILLNNSSPAMLFKSIRSVASGQYWIGRQSVGDLVDMIRQLRLGHDADSSPRRYGLTARELEIVAAVVAGETNRVIAQRFSLSEDTVKHHLTHIFDKLGVFTRLELALFAIHHHLVPAATPAVPAT
jgi:two-component system, NarL family, nitrate/nitrite response regulator NarL